MYKTLSLLIVCALMLGVSGTTVRAEEPEMNAAQVVEALYAAVENQDLATAAAYLADDVVLVLIPPPPNTNGTFVGKEAVLGWYETLIQNNLKIEFDNAEVAGDRFTMTNLTWVDDLPVAPVAFDGAGVVQDGLVKAINWIVTPQSLAELQAAFAKAADEELVRSYLSHWDTVNGQLEGVDELLTEDFVSHNMPEGDRAVMLDAIAGFRAGNPNTYFSIDNLVIADGKAFVTNRMWKVPEDAPEGAEGEPISPPLLLILAIKDGKISERWLFAPLTQ